MNKSLYNLNKTVTDYRLFFYLFLEQKVVKKPSAITITNRSPFGIFPLNKIFSLNRINSDIMLTTQHRETADKLIN